MGKSGLSTAGACRVNPINRFDPLSGRFFEFSFEVGLPFFVRSATVHPNKMSDVHEFILRGGQNMTLGEMAAFRDKLPLLKVKAETLDPDNFPHLPGQVRFLVRFVEDVLDGAYATDDLAATPESVFALQYVLRDIDIIPDDVPGGLADDSAILRAVIESHEEAFRAFAAGNKIDWEAVTTLS